MTEPAQPPNCPVCKTHTLNEALQADGVVLTGVQAILGKSDELVTDVYKSLTQFDGHVAITWIAELLLVVAALTETDPYEVLALHRQQLNEASGQL